MSERWKNAVLGTRVRGMTGAVLVVMFAVVWPVWSAPGAGACSCVSMKASEMVAEASAAFIGVATQVHELQDASGETISALEFDVLDPIKGEMGASVVLQVRSDEDSCGTPRFLPGWEDSYFGHSVGTACTKTTDGRSGPLVARGQT